MNNNKKKVSIIIPAYNEASHIQDCLHMLLNQSGEYEIIIINDGSTDQTDSLIQPFLTDQRIKYIKQENKGASISRNTGMSIASGDYITFVDADDQVEPGFISHLIHIIESSDIYDIIWFSNSKFGQDNEDKSYEESRTDTILKSMLGADEMIYREHQYMWSVWSKAYKKSFLKEHNIIFDPTIKLGEDVFFNFECYSYAPNSYIVDQDYYRYIVNPDSITHSRWDIKDMQWFDLCYRKYKELEKINPELWKRKDVQFWMNRFILNYGILIVGRVARASCNMKFSKRIKYIKQLTKHTRNSMKKMGMAYIMKSILSKDMTVIKLLFMDIFTPLYLLKFNNFKQ